MNNIVIGFSRPNGWFEPFSWLIRLVTWSSYSHVYFIGQPLFNSEEIIYKEFQVPISDAAKLSTVQFAIDNCGQPYAVGQVVGFGWVLLMRLFGKKVKNPFYSNSSFFCSELVGDVLNQIIEKGDAIDPSTASPKDIYNFMISKGYQPLS